LSVELLLLNGLTVKPLEWSEPAPPTKGVCFYDHCRAVTPFGVYSIEWKSWKDYDDCVVYCPENAEGDTFVVCDGTLEGAKVAAQENFNSRIASVVMPIAREEPAAI
jgi:hypothetical protein